MKTIFTVGAVVLATCLLSGCVNEQKVNQLASNVQTLNAKIARLEQDMKALRPQIYAAKSEANRANTRLDAQDYFDCLRCLRMYEKKKKNPRQHVSCRGFF
nr:lipoprotein YqhH [Escherichia coli]